jgi:outer membrane immunogenic protein
MPAAPLLIYTTGSLAYGNVAKSAIMPGSASGIGGNNAGGFSYNCGAPTGMVNCFYGASSQTMVGWTVGAGIEYIITNKMTLKAEYLYADLGHSFVDTVATLSGGLAPASFTANFGTVSFNVARLGINYKLN